MVELFTENEKLKNKIAENEKWLKVSKVKEKTSG